MFKNNFCSAIIVAAGRGNRMGTDVSKQFLHLGGKPILAYALEKFQRCEAIDEIILVTRKDYIKYCRKELVQAYGFTKVKKIVAGGSERQDSVYKGLNEVDKRSAIVAVHDGVRPFVNVADIQKTIMSAVRCGSGILGVRAKDTIKICNPKKVVASTPVRDYMWYIQTPQTFKYDILMDAYKKAERDDFLGTDDSMLVERLGVQVKIVEGSYNNIKITTIEDLTVGEAYLNMDGVNIGFAGDMDEKN